MRIIGLSPYLSQWNGVAPIDDPLIIDASGVEVMGFNIVYEQPGGFPIDIRKGSALIHDCTINFSPSGDGIRLIDASYCEIYNNLIWGGGAGPGSAILLQRSATLCTRNRIINNIIEGGDYGVTVDQTGSAQFTRNSILGNEFYDYHNEALIFILATKNVVRGNSFFPEPGATGFIDGAKYQFISGNTFKNTWDGTHTTVGVAEETIFTVVCPQPMTRISGYLRLNNMVAGDDFIFRVKKSYDGGITWDIIDETNLVGVQTIARFDFDLPLEDADEQMRVTIERQSATDRAFYHKRMVSDS